MLILLPPSEGKAEPRRGRPLDLEAGPLATLLAAPRRAAVDALVALCSGPEDVAIRTLGVTFGQVEEVRRNARLRELPTAPAERIYNGVLYDSLGLSSLDPSAHRRALAWVVTVSALYGLVRPGERIAPYRLSSGVTLPGLGGVAAHWRQHLDPVVRGLAGRGLVVDLRSSAYAAFWRPAPDLARRVATVRVLHEVAGRRQVVSHLNKATKGRLVRALLEDGRDARTPSALVTLLGDLGWQVEPGPTTGHATGQATVHATRGVQVDVVVGEL